MAYNNLEKEDISIIKENSINDTYISLNNMNKDLKEVINKINELLKSNKESKKLSYKKNK